MVRRAGGKWLADGQGGQWWGAMLSAVIARCRGGRRLWQDFGSAVVFVLSSIFFAPIEDAGGCSSRSGWPIGLEISLWVAAPMGKHLVGVWWASAATGRLVTKTY